MRAPRVFPTEALCRSARRNRGGENRRCQVLAYGAEATPRVGGARRRARICVNMYALERCTRELARCEATNSDRRELSSPAATVSRPVHRVQSGRLDAVA